ncbi:MAG: S46 family peptidase [Rikenellaceae bacterium]|nr:S46 family peptidase [Rikenellaceae bacterium]
MKKLLTLLALIGVAFTAVADEGMWLLPYIKKMNQKDMKQHGCKLKAEDIYSAEKSSLKDAIVIFGGGCTGEIVSPNGLLFTNHHCGYDAIQKLSSVEHDYLKDGFWAMNYGEELPAEGLEVRFVRHIFDVTADVVGSIPSTASQSEYEQFSNGNKHLVENRLKEQYPGMEVVIPSFFGDNQYFAFVYEVYTDIRLVGTPPSSIGKFGGDTDNWMWPRHTGDFSVFRVYAGKDNRPAAYSEENVPYKAEKWLDVSLDGIEEGDFGMIMGFPGSTERYMTSYEIDYMLEVDNPQRIYIRGERQQILRKFMDADQAIRIQYDAKYARSSNYWKNSIGMSRGIEKLNVRDKKAKQEAEFQAWANANTLPEEGFIDALSLIERSQLEGREERAAVQYINEAFMQAVEMLQMMFGVEDIEGFYKDFNADVDRAVAKRMFQIYRENNKYLPSIYEKIDAEFGGNSDAYVDWLYDNSVFTSLDKVRALSEEEFDAAFQADPLYELATSLVDIYRELSPAIYRTIPLYDEGHRLYIKGLMMMQPDKAWASDANFTIRLTYGNVLPYSPADGIVYKHYTTIEGVMAKEDPSNPVEFTVPERLKELYAKKDYGRYADKNGELPVAFLVNCDITGGNSGSPVMNDKGQLIGLAFDGNWEAMSGDVAFEPELQRTIAVDIRYVLFIIEKYGNAKWLIDELTIK